MSYKAMGRKKNFPVFDCDSHIYEPPEIWDRYIPQNQQEFAKTHFYRDADRLILVRNSKIALEIPTNGNILGKPGIPDSPRKSSAPRSRAQKIGMKRSAETPAPETPMRG